MNQRGDTKTLITLISKDLAIRNLDPESDFINIKKQLIASIQKLLDGDFSHLLNALYRIDISEEKVRQVLALNAPHDIASGIADLVINRELQKIESRKKYAS